MDYLDRISQTRVGELLAAWILAAVAFLGLVGIGWVTEAPQEHEAPATIATQASPDQPGAKTSGRTAETAAEPGPRAAWSRWAVACPDGPPDLGGGQPRRSP